MMSWPEVWWLIWKIKSLAIKLLGCFFCIFLLLKLGLWNRLGVLLFIQYAICTQQEHNQHFNLTVTYSFKIQSNGKRINSQILSDCTVYEKTGLCNSVSKIYSQKPNSCRVNNIIAISAEANLWLGDPQSFSHPPPLAIKTHKHKQ